MDRTTRKRTSSVQVLPNRRAEHQLLVRAMRELVTPGRPLHVLEAGCGQRWPLDLGDVPLHVTGVDTDADALRIRREKVGDLDVEIVGDLRTVPLPEDTFDVVYCSFVLEHIDGAAAVLDRLVRSLRPGGRLLLRVPDGRSVYGFTVKHSPHKLHVLYKKHVEGFPDAGKPGHAPYPTVYDDVVSLRGLRTYAAERGLEIVEEWGILGLTPGLGRARSAVAWGLRAVGRLSGGRLSGEHTDLGFVLQRPALS